MSAEDDQDPLADRRARFRRLYEDNVDPIAGYARRRTATAEEAHDVVSDTFLAAWRRLDDVPDGERARLWLYGTARRVLANHHRGSRRQRRLVIKLQTEAAGRVRSVEPTDVPETERIAAAFSRLSGEDQELLLLVGWENLDTAAVAEVLGCKPSTARVRLHRARERFARELASEGLQRDGTAGHVNGRWATARPEAEDAR